MGVAATPAGEVVVFAGGIIISTMFVAMTWLVARRRGIVDVAPRIVIDGQHCVVIEVIYKRTPDGGVRVETKQFRQRLETVPMNMENGHIVDWPEARRPDIPEQLIGRR